MQPELLEIFPRISELLELAQNAEWSIWEIISTAFAVLGAIGTMLATYIKYRTSGARRSKRLKEFLEEREKRALTARWDLREITQRPETEIQQFTSQRVFSTVFPKQLLKRTLKRRGWARFYGEGQAIDKAIDRSRSELTTAQRAVETTRHELFLVHMLRGATLDAEGRHEDALDQFREALTIKPDDLQALECAGLQLVLVGSGEAAIAFLDAVTVTDSSQDSSIGEYDPAGWNLIQTGQSPVSPLEINYLTRMLAVSANRSDDLNQARAHRAISFAYERLCEPRLLHAARHARLAANIYPRDTSVEEIAESWELLGCLTYNRSAHYTPSALSALREARRKYRGVRPVASAQAHVERINKLIETIEDYEPDVDSAAAPEDESERKFLQHLLAPLQRRKEIPASPPTSSV